MRRGAAIALARRPPCPPPRRGLSLRCALLALLAASVRAVVLHVPSRLQQSPAALATDELALFAAREQGRMSCLSAVRSASLAFYEPLLAGVRGVGILGVPFANRNLGALLITLGELRLLAQLGRTPHLLCHEGKKLPAQPNCPQVREMRKKLGSPAVVLMQAGGKWGDLWRSPQGHRLDDVSAPSNYSSTHGWDVRVVAMPNSVYYSRTAKGANWAAKDAAVVNSWRGDGFFTLLVRQAGSLDTLREMWPDAGGSSGPRFGLVPDTACMVDAPRARRGLADGDHGVKTMCSGDRACTRLPGALPSGEPAAFNCSDNRRGGPLFLHESTVDGDAAAGDGIAGIVAFYDG